MSMNTIKQKPKQIIFIVVGVSVILFSHLLIDKFSTSKILVIGFKLIEDLGIGLFVAAVVSLFFDIWYHESIFGEPIEDIDQKVKAVSQTIDQMSSTVADFNQVLKSAHANGIHAIYRRKTDQEIIEWKDQVRSTLTNAKKYILIMGRTLDEILPARNKDNGLFSILEDKANDVPIIFLLADTFIEDSDFRLEASDRAGEHASSLYVRTRETIKQILALSESRRDQGYISIRLLKKGPPFALFMTEKSALIEPYLPYLEGGESIVYEVHASSTLSMSSTVVSKNLHSAHKLCFSKLYSKARHVSDAINEYVNKRSIDRPNIVNSFNLYLNEAKRLKDFEDDTIKRAELF
jgi:hypothetical protein